MICAVLGSFYGNASVFCVCETQEGGIEPIFSPHPCPSWSLDWDRLPAAVNPTEGTGAAGVLAAEGYAPVSHACELGLASKSVLKEITALVRFSVVLGNHWVCAAADQSTTLFNVPWGHIWWIYRTFCMRAMAGHYF